jgi:hypothetical protein
VVSSNLIIYNDSIWFLKKLRTILKLPTMMGIPKKKEGKEKGRNKIWNKKSTIRILKFINIHIHHFKTSFMWPRPFTGAGRRFWANLLLRTTQMCSQRFGGVSGVSAYKHLRFKHAHAHMCNYIHSTPPFPPPTQHKH